MRDAPSLGRPTRLGISRWLAHCPGAGALHERGGELAWAVPSDSAAAPRAGAEMSKLLLRVWALYERALLSDPLKTNMANTAILFAIGDMVGQAIGSLRTGVAVDWKRWWRAVVVFRCVLASARLCDRARRQRKLTVPLCLWLPADIRGADLLHPCARPLHLYREHVAPAGEEGPAGRVRPSGQDLHRALRLLVLFHIRAVPPVDGADGGCDPCHGAALPLAQPSRAPILLLLLLQDPCNEAQMPTSSSSSLRSRPLKNLFVARCFQG